MTFLLLITNAMSHSFTVTTDFLPLKLVLKNVQAHKYLGNIHWPLSYIM